MKEKLIFSLNRDNSYEKIEDFYDKLHSIYFTIKSHWELKQQFEEEKANQDKRTKLSHLFLRLGEHYKHYEIFCMYLVLIINFFVLIGYEFINGSLEIHPAIRFIIIILNAFHILGSICQLFGYYLVNGPIIVAEQEFLNNAKKHSKKKKRKEDESLIPSNVSLLDKFLPQIGSETARNKLRIFLTPLSLYLILYLTISILGLVFPLLLTILLADFLRRFQLITDLLTTLFVKQRLIFGQTAFLGLTVLYLYTSFGFWIYNSDFYDQTNNTYDCPSLWKCFLFNVYSGYRAGGGIGDLMVPPSFNTLGHLLGRYVYDFTYFLFIITILSAIISGIVIDSFNDIRDKHTAIQEDNNSRCLICSHESSLFDRYAEGFVKHIEVEHNPWHYLFFFLYLHFKQKSEYTSQEAFIDEMIQCRNLKFFPVSKAMSLENVEKKILEGEE